MKTNFDWFYNLVIMSKLRAFSWMPMPIRDEVLNWLAEARADLRHAESSISIGDYNWACFASQKAAEKH